MVEINNQRKAFLDMLAWSEGTDNGRQKTRNHGLWRHCRRRAICWLLRSPSQTCHAKPKTQINRRRTLPASFRWWDAYRKQLGLKDFSEKSGRCGIAQQIKERGALPMIDRGDIRQAIDRCSNIWASLPGAGYGQFEHKADSLIAKFKEAGGTVRDWCMSKSHRDYLALVICIIVCLSWAVNHYRDNAITYKAQRDKNARELKLANAAITDMQMRQRDVAALDAKYTKELAWC